MEITSRIGFLIPSMNTALEPDLAALPPGVVGHVQRMPSAPRVGSTTSENSNRIALMNAQLPLVVPDLPLADLDVVAYACTAGSFFSEWKSPTDLERHISDMAGLPVASTAGAVIEILQEFPGAKISLLSPYAPAVNQRMASVLEMAGANVVQVQTDPLFVEPGVPIGKEHPEDIVEFVTGNLSPDAEVVLLPCSGWRALEAQPDIQKLTGLPVVTANQALFWSVLRALGMDSAGLLPLAS